MKHQLWLFAAAGLLATAPAAAQNETTAAPPTNATNETVTADTNVVATNMTVEAEPALPPTTSDLASDAAARDDGDRGGFPWGAIGLVGLIGLLGRRRAN